jgi:hypothetical protein
VVHRVFSARLGGAEFVLALREVAECDAAKLLGVLAELDIIKRNGAEVASAG